MCPMTEWNSNRGIKFLDNPPPSHSHVPDTGGRQRHLASLQSCGARTSRYVRCPSRRPLADALPARTSAPSGIGDLTAPEDVASARAVSPGCTFTERLTGVRPEAFAVVSAVGRERIGASNGCEHSDMTFRPMRLTITEDSRKQRSALALRARHNWSAYPSCTCGPTVGPRQSVQPSSVPAARSATGEYSLALRRRSTPRRSRPTRGPGGRALLCNPHDDRSGDDLTDHVLGSYVAGLPSNAAGHGPIDQPESSRRTDALPAAARGVPSHGGAPDSTRRSCI